MNFLDSTGLEYFYGKLKEKFIRSVNSYTPDANGNVTITNVATADNLASPDGQTIYDTFIYRTSGGRASISNGEAQLIYIDGNVDIVGRVQESLTIDVENNIQATCDITTWRNQIDETGLYNFTYTRPSSAQETSSWNPGIGTWRYNNSIVSLSTFGIECFNIIAPSVVISTTGANIRNLQIVPNTWMSAFGTDGTYVFTYNEESWTFEEESISLVSLGISMSGTVEEGDEIIVNYQSGTPNSILTVSYVAPERGTILVSKPTTFESTGFNQFDKSSMYIQNASIVNGAIASNSGTYIAYCHAKGGVDNGYVAYSANAYIRNIGWCANLPTIGESVVTTGGSSSGTLASIPFNEDGYVVVVVTNISDLCIHPKWSGTDDTKYEDYVAPDVITLPTTSIDSQVLPLNSYGMPAVGNISDRLNLDAGFYIQNIGRYAYSASNLETVQALGVDYDYDDTNIFYVLNNPVIYSVDVDSIYNVNDFGTEEFLNTPVAVKAYMLYGQNLRDKLRTGVVEKTGDTMTGDLRLQGDTSASKSLRILDKTITVGSPPSSGNQYGGAVRFSDSNNMEMGGVQNVYTSGGATALQLAAKQTIGSTLYQNILHLRVNADGTPFIYTNASDAWCEALNAVSKSGDTITGLLTLRNGATSVQQGDQARVILRNPSITMGNTHTQTILGEIMFSDTGAQFKCSVAADMLATDTTRLVLQARNWVSGTATANYIRMTMNTSGGAGIEMSHPAAWLKALATQVDESETKVSNVISANTSAGFSITSVNFKKWGKFIQLNVVAKKSSAASSAADITVGTIVAGKRPMMGSGAICTSSTINFSYISTGGSLVVNGTWAANVEKTINAVYMLA